MTEKTVEEKVKVEKTVKAPVRFYFPKSAKKSYRTEHLSIRADNHVYILDPKDKNYQKILDFLRKHRENSDNGGSEFFELSTDREDIDTSRGRLIDKLMQMNVSQLRKACGTDIELQTITSKGQLIDIYLKQQNL